MSESLTTPFLAVGGSIAIIGLIMFLAYRSEKKRRDLLTAEAVKIGCQFTSRPDTSFVAELREVFWVFRYFRKRAVTNLMERVSLNGTLRLFDYAYLRPGSRSPSYWSVLLVTSPRLNLPKFTMGANGGSLRLRDTFSATPVAFSVKDFCDTHKVHAEEGDSVATAFTPGLQQFLAQNPGYSMEGAGNNFVLYIADLKLKPQNLRTAMDDGNRILAELTAN